MNKLRKGDEVIVITGRDKGKRGKIALRQDDSHLIIEGINLVKKHTKPNPMAGTTGGIVEKTMPIHQSNVAIYNATTGKADRVGIHIIPNYNYLICRDNLYVPFNTALGHTH